MFAVQKAWSSCVCATISLQHGPAAGSSPGKKKQDVSASSSDQRIRNLHQMVFQVFIVDINSRRFQHTQPPLSCHHCLVKLLRALAAAALEFPQLASATWSK
jgi:hypothetical protein